MTSGNDVFRYTGLVVCEHSFSVRLEEDASDEYRLPHSADRGTRKPTEYTYQHRKMCAIVSGAPVCSNYDKYAGYFGGRKQSIPTVRCTKGLAP